jgi:acetylornithine/succinyldiaminopimelate/putrescine aminotransferase
MALSPTTRRRAPAAAGPVEAYRRAVNPRKAEVLESLGWLNTFPQAQGSWLRDARGRRFLDMVAGFGAIGLGHRHPRVMRALQEALGAEGGPFTVPVGLLTAQGELAARLCGLAGGGLRKVFFGNSGTEGIELALKLAMAATGRSHFITAERGYHGLTLGAMSVMGYDSWLEPLPARAFPAQRVAVGDVDAVASAMQRAAVAAVVIEVVQGLGGGHSWEASELRMLAALCRKRGALLIVDEVLTGIGRTGSWFAFQEAGIEPSVVVTSKGLTAGVVPLCAVMMSDDAYDGLFSGPARAMIHSSTFEGNLLAMTSGLTCLRVIEREGVLDNVRALGRRLRTGLEALMGEPIGVRSVRGRGLLLAVEVEGLDQPDDAYGGVACCQELYKRGVIAYTAGHAPNCVKLTPPLTLSEAEVDTFLDRLHSALTEVQAMRGS